MDDGRSAAAPYRALAEVIERELALVPTRDFDAMRAVKRERAAIVRRLPATPPPEAREALARCARAQGQILNELHQVRTAIVAELGQIRRARQAAHGYAPARALRPQQILASA
jgi:hypothetical protein